MQQDYILRMVQMLTEALLAIIQSRKAGQYKEAREQIQAAGRYLLRMDFDVLLLFDKERILNQFKDFNNRFETKKCVLGADLLYELALIEEAEQQSLNAIHLKELCLYLYTIGLPKEVEFQDSEHFDKVSTLIKELRGQELCEKAAANLRFFEDYIKALKMRKEPP